MQKSVRLDRVTLGVCYYPEHWDRKLWRSDIERMLSHGITCVRVGEFAWNLMEKAEGVYDFSLWDDFLDLAEETGMRVIFCTPTATPPAWLTHKHPEVLNVSPEGMRYRHGLRRHCGLTSPVFLKYCDAITLALAQRYGDRKCIVGWQIDNEVNCEVDLYCAPCDREAFREYLKEKFGTLDELNDKMGTVFWNQTYTDWDEIDLPGSNVQSAVHGNPHMELEQRRFISKAAVGFIRRQIDILRPAIGRRFITTNGLFGHLDYRELLRSGLDFICYDNYPDFSYDVDAEDDGMRDRSAAKQFAAVRAISSLFGVMEEQSGPGGWTFRMMQSAPKPGQMRLWSWQAVANGASYMSWFRWRTATMGTEMYWHGLLDQDSRDNRRIRELDVFRREAEKLCREKPLFSRAPFRAEAAVLSDYDNEWDGEADRWHGRLDEPSRDGLFRAMIREHVPFDRADIRDETKIEELEKYSVVFYPHPAILTPQRAALLRRYAENGGQVVFGAFTGRKDLYGRTTMQVRPGPAAELCGCIVEESTAVGKQDGDIRIDLCGTQAAAPLFNDVLEVTDGERIAAYLDGWYAGKCAACEKKIGKGRAIYVGCAFGEDVSRALLAHTGLRKAGEGIVDAPEAVDVFVRGDVLFVLNPQKYPVALRVRTPLRDILTDSAAQGRVMIEPYGVYAFDLEGKEGLAR